MSPDMPWYAGAPLLAHLESVHIASDRNLADMRFPVQYVLRPNLNFRGFAGTVASGIVRRGDEVLALPSGKRSRVKSIVTYDGELEEAFSPQAVTVTLEDEIDVSRGDMICRPANRPKEARDIDAMVCWMSERPLSPSARYRIKHTSRTALARVEYLTYRIDVNSLHRDEDAEGVRQRAHQPSSNSVSIQDIIERSCLPSVSIALAWPSARRRWKFSWPARFSAIHSRANVPSWISVRTSFMF